MDEKFISQCKATKKSTLDRRGNRNILKYGTSDMILVVFRGKS